MLLGTIISERGAMLEADKDHQSRTERRDVMSVALHYIIPRLVRRRVLVLICGLLGLIVALIHLHLTEPYYDSTVVLGPGGSSPASGQRNPLSSLASLAGASTAAEKLSPYDELQQILGSNDLAAHLAHDEDLLVLLFPGRRDVAAHAWKPSGGLKAGAKELIYGWLNWPIVDGPDVSAIRAALNKRLSVTRDGKSNVMTVTFRSDSPQSAKRFLSEVVSESDEIVRVQFGDVATKFSNFILDKLKTVTSVDQRASLDSLLTEYQRLETLSQVSLPFTASVIDPPSASEMPSGPSLLLIVFGWIFAGVLVGISFALLPASLIKRSSTRKMPSNL